VSAEAGEANFSFPLRLASKYFLKKKKKNGKRKKRKKRKRKKKEKRKRKKKHQKEEKKKASFAPGYIHWALSPGTQPLML
jgi:transposase